MATILVNILGNAKQFKAELDSAVASTEKANSGFGKMSKAAGVAGAAIAGGLVVGLVKSVEAADNMQQATARMNTAFAASHVSAKAFAGGIEDAETSSRKLGFTNESVKNSLGSLIVATHNGKKALSDLSVAQDVARFKHVGLESATKTLTMAMAGSQRATKQLGIDVPKTTAAVDAATGSYHKQLEALKAQFPATSKQTQAEHDRYLAIKNTLDQNYAAVKAQATITDKNTNAADVIATVTSKLHGQADAYSKTAAGGMAQFHSQVDDLEEKLGKALLPALTNVATAFAGVATYLSEHTTLAKGLVIGLGALATVLIGVSVASKLYTAGAAIATAATWLWDAALDANGFVLVAIAIAALVAAMVILYTRSATVRAIVQGAFADIKQAGQAALGFITNTALPAFEDAWSHSGGVVGEVVSAIKGFVNGVKTEVQGVINFVGDLIHGRWGKLWGDAVQIVRGIVLQIKAVFVDIPKSILSHLGDIAGAAQTLGSAILNGIVGAVKGLPSALGSVVSAGLSALRSLIESFHVTVKTKKYLGVPVPVGMSLGFGGGGGGGDVGVDLDPGGFGKGITGGLGPPPTPAVGSRAFPHGTFTATGSGTRGSFTVPSNLGGGGGGGGSGSSSDDKAQKALDALKAKLQAVADAAQKVAETVQAKMDAAFSKIKDYALKAFDGATQAGLKKLQDHAAAVSAQIASDLQDTLNTLNAANAVPTASEAALAALQAQHAQQGLTDATNSAATDLATAMAGGDPAAIAAAQKEVDDAAYNQRVADLTVAAATERSAANDKLAIDTKAAQDAAAVKQKAADDQAAKDQLNFNASRELKKAALDQELTDLQAHLDEHPKAWKKTHDKIMKMFKDDFGPDFSTAGINDGAAYINGLKKAFDAVDPLAKSTGTAQGNAKKAGAKVPHMALGGIVTSPTYALIGEAGPEAVIPLSGMSGGTGGGVVGGVTVIVNGWVGNDQAVAEKVRNELIRMGRNTTGGALGRFA